MTPIHNFFFFLNDHNWQSNQVVLDLYGTYLYGT